MYIVSNNSLTDSLQCWDLTGTSEQDPVQCCCRTVKDFVDKRQELADYVGQGINKALFFWVKTSPHDSHCTASVLLSCYSSLVLSDPDPACVQFI